ncbi:hypothetical protein FUSO4_10935 [Fusobacterium necrophorum DJ-1]|uniref:Uncharacterized protein n=1 Tax=Fusobacterium necrophorum DJ-2 TaxID=1441737 RepID=A0AB73C1L8_9FUSO|nr:hypothetical protein FUSO4_10935 [Fusobacterium necrophorum DJ-1]KDE70897.1 hypothetical protein FUSO8_08580 [Fusobacterium necrophorum DJ-2]
MDKRQVKSSIEKKQRRSTIIGKKSTVEDKIYPSIELYAEKINLETGSNIKSKGRSRISSSIWK